MAIPATTLLFVLLAISSSSHATRDSSLGNEQRRLIDVHGGPESVLWVVQLSDLHFSVHDPRRALDFKRLVGPALSMINPSLVLLTGDLTDGKSKDLLTMKLIEDEWGEYQNVMEDVVRRSGLDKTVFYDLRGNHDNFGVPESGGALDFFSKYSINAQLGRTRKVSSVTLQTAEQKHLFVGLDSTGSVGVRGPTNLFGHSTDKLLEELDLELSQWGSESAMKIAFGHFPLSFSAPSPSGKSLKDVFLNHSLSAYLSGHLHTKFGKNLKRNYQGGHGFSPLSNFFQLNPHQVSYDKIVNCSSGASPVKEFWEWEMGDWRKSRAMRILAIDRGHVSFVDFDLKLGSKETIILPTFPLDSRFMSTASSHQKYKCEVNVPSYYDSIRSLVFSDSRITSVTARIFDKKQGDLKLVLEKQMARSADNSSRGDLYLASWNYKDFEDLSPDRYWLQIEAVDLNKKSTLTELRPFSISGLNAEISWTWTEFKVMGCQWAAIYFPLLWSSLSFMLSALIVPKALLIFTNYHFGYKDFAAQKGVIQCIRWALQELCKIPVVWFGLLFYIFYLISFPWCTGKVFTEGENWGYMTYKGWALSLNGKENHEYVGFPDILVVVISHLFYVVFPSIIVSGILAAERAVYREHLLLVNGKKEDDSVLREGKSKSWLGKRLIRKVLLVVCLAICWKHFKNCRALVKAYEMNPILHFPVYSFTIPLLLAFAIHKTRSV